jgi:hypothetical protein
MSVTRNPLAQRQTTIKVTSVCLGVILAAAFTGCSGSSPNNGTTPTPAAKTSVQVSMGDAPADWMLAFSMNINSMSLTGSNGTVSVVSSSMPMEMMHLMGTMQPLAMINVPQGTYTGASVTIGSATVMYMDPVTKQPLQATIAGPMTATVTFPSPVNLGSTPIAMGFDLDLASSVTADASGKLSMNPVFHVATAMQGSGSPLDPMNGGIQQMMGSISGVSGSSFTMTSMQAAQTFTFQMNSSTTFEGTTMSGMGNGMLVMVDASLQPDGSLMATNVQSMMSSGGVMGGGIITAVTGHPAISLTLVMQNGVGSGMMSTYFANGTTVDVSGSTTFTIDKDNMDMSALPFTPTFDESHIYAGQSVMPVSSSGMTSGGMGGGMMGGSPLSGTITASQLLLVPQGLSGTSLGTITSGATTSFTLKLASDSAFTTLTGATNVEIFQQSKTTVAGTSSIASGSSVHAFGLLFFDAGQWKLVASRIGAN